jgi:hypothetical protein
MKEFNYADCLRLFEGLGEVNASNMSAKFNYAISKNRNMLEGIIKDLNKTIEETDDFKKYREAKNKILEKYARKDSEGNPIMVNQDAGGGRTIRVYDVPERFLTDPGTSCGIELQSLRKKHKKVIDEREKQIDSYNELLEDISEFVPFLIDLKEVPSGLSRRAMDAVFLIIKDEEVMDEKKEPEEKEEKQKEETKK